jgi:hypothetical protein
VEFRESPGWAFYLGNHAPEELGYRRAAYGRFAFLYNVRAVGSTAGVVFDNVRDSVVFGLFVEGSDGNCVTVMGNPGAELNLHMSSLVLRDCVRRPLCIGGDDDVAGLAVIGGVAGVVVEGLDVESVGLGAWGGLTLRGGRVISHPFEGWNGNVFAWGVEVADVLFTAEVATGGHRASGGWRRTAALLLLRRCREGWGSCVQAAWRLSSRCTWWRFLRTPRTPR